MANENFNANMALLKKRVEEKEIELQNNPVINAAWGAENHKPQINQLYDDITMLSKERTHYRKALSDLKNMLKHQEMDEHMLRVVIQTVNNGLEFDPYGGK